MRAALVIAGKDLRQRLRDRSALVIAFIAPVVLASIVTFAFGSGFADDDFGATFAVLDQDQTRTSKTFIDQVLRAPDLRDQVVVRLPKTVDEARTLAATDRIAAAFVIPRGFERAVVAGRPEQMTVIKNADAPIGAEVGEALARGYTDQINAARLAVLTTLDASAGPPDLARIPELAAQAAVQRAPVQLTQGEVAVRDVSGASYFGPAMAIFFVFFTVGFGARSLLAEREQGTMARLVGAPIGRTSILAGKALAVYALGVASMVTTFLVMGLLFGVQWGSLPAIAVLTLLVVAAAMGVTAVVQTLARTQEQAGAFASLVTVTLAILGGNFFPLFQLPRGIQYASMATPNGWALRGFTDIAYDGATLGDLIPNVAAVGAFALVTGAIAVLRARRVTVA